MQQQTRVFFVVSEPDKMQRLFTTLEDAKWYAKDLKKNQYLLYVAIVQNAFQRNEGEWQCINPDDINHIFTIED